MLDNITVAIEDDELIVGNAASKPMAVEFDCDYGTWSRDEIQALRDEGYNVSHADEAELITLNEYWKARRSSAARARSMTKNACGRWRNRELCCLPGRAARRGAAVDMLKADGV